MILLTGQGDHNVDMEAIEAGATDYLVKDETSPSRLERTIRYAVQLNTERKQAELVRLQAAALESADNAILITNHEGTITWVNSAFTALTGYAPGEVLGQNSRILESDQHDAAFYESMWQTLGSGKVWHGEMINLRKDGSTYFEEQTITPVLNETGEITNFIAVKQDISERRRAEEGLRTSEIRYRRLFEAARDGILILNGVTLRITDVNPFMTELLGYSRDEFLGKELWEIGLFSDKEASQNAFRELQAKGYLRYEDLPLQTSQGKLREVEFVSNVYQEDGNQVIQCNIRDITDRKRFEQTLQEKNIELGNANLAKDRFLANMSHELRTPLNAIIGFTGTLLMGLPGPLNADQEHQLSIVQTGARHLLSLINDLLDLARVESGKVEIKDEPLVCQSVVEEVAAALRPLAEGKGLEFKIKAPKSGVRIAADRRILSQILINLSNNAIKFTERGQVRIQLRRRRANGQTLASIEVIDTGIGIRIEDQEKLFQAFQQVRTDHRNEGTGLGLYLSEKLAILIKGKIEFESEYGKGSTFRLLIPTA
jgi:protein-histidine pros-kinase